MLPTLAKCSDAIVLLPGIMGSELVDSGGNVVWGMKFGLLARQVALGDVFSRLALPPGGTDDGVRASRLLQLPVKIPFLTGIEPYPHLQRGLEKVALRPRAVTTFPFDWRRSIEHSARELAVKARAHLAAWQAEWAGLPLQERRNLPEPRLTLVAHSMGGLVARWFAEVEGGRDIVRRIITLGTPFAGSLNAVRILSSGQLLPFGLLADAIRDTGRTLPGLYELVARYNCVEEPGSATPLRKLTVDDMAAIGADRHLAQAAFDVQTRLQDAIAAAGDQRCPLHTLIGVQQPTLQSVSLVAGEARFKEEYNGVDERGDGTVFRYAAAPKGERPMPLPQTHGGLCKTSEGITFVQSVLTDRQLGEVQAPPGSGIRVPDVVRPVEQFAIELLDGNPGATCLIKNAETNQQVGATVVQKAGDRLAARATLPAPGVYRVEVAIGGYSPVEALVMAIAE
jgi:hypothetical protein